MMRIIVNGKSAGDPALRQAVAQIREEGHSIEVRVTWEAGDAARYAQESVRQEIDMIVAAGGDGTVNEVANGMLQDSTDVNSALGILPYGTANDFATACGIPLNDPCAALTKIVESPPTRIDVGRVAGRYFVNVVSGGFGAEVTANTPPELKKMLGGAAYTLMGVVTAAKMTPHRARVVAQGIKAEGELIALTVANGRQCGGGIQVGPRAQLNDGLLDVLALHDVSTQNLGQVFSEIMNIGAEENEFVSYVQTDSFSIETDRSFQMNLDGEPIHGTKFQFDVFPECLPVVLGDGAPIAKK